MIHWLIQTLLIVYKRKLTCIGNFSNKRRNIFIVFKYLTACSIPYFLTFKFVRVSTLVGRYFYNMYIVKKFEIVFSSNVKDKHIFPCFHNS